jgi:hypothetical protein
MRNPEVKAALAAAKEKQRAAKAQAKQAKRAERARRKASNDPADMGRFRQIGRAYKLTHEHDKALPWLLLGAFLLPVAVSLGVGLLVDHWIMGLLFGLPLGLMLAMIVLARRVRAATFKRYAGQAGSAEVALSMLPRQWVSTPVIAITRQQDAVHRTVGPGGLVLIGEGDPGRLKPLLAAELRKHEKVAYGVTTTTIVMGDREGQVPLAKLTDHIRKLPKTLQPHQVTDLKQRLRALDAVRPQVPMPKGPMPTSPRQAKGSRQAMRGR